MRWRRILRLFKLMRVISLFSRLWRRSEPHIGRRLRRHILLLHLLRWLLRSTRLGRERLLLRWLLRSTRLGRRRLLPRHLLLDLRCRTRLLLLGRWLQLARLDIGLSSHLLLRLWLWLV